MDRSDRFNRELDELENHLPNWARGVLRRARSPDAVFLRTLVALLLIIGGIAGIVLPVLGFWMVPLPCWRSTYRSFAGRWGGFWLTSTVSSRRRRAERLRRPFDFP
jgi:hypothetical protein